MLIHKIQNVTGTHIECHCHKTSSYHIQHTTVYFYFQHLKHISVSEAIL